MSRRRVLTDEQSVGLAVWYADYERVGTFAEKCRELGVSEDAARDAIKRVRGELPRPARRKLTDAEINQLVDDISRGTSDAPEAA